MANEILRILPEEFDVDLQNDVVGSPWESRLYKGKDSCGQPVGLKVYQYGKAIAYREKAYKQVQRYKEIIEQVDEVLDKIKNPNCVGDVITWEVVHIDKVGMIEYDGEDVPCALVKLIEGATLAELQEEVDEFLKANGSDFSSSELLDVITGDIRQLTGISDVRLAPVNTKPVKTEYGYHMIITDVCQLVGNIQV